jgi:tetratricopeptide (TPR) repeat protein
MNCTNCQKPLTDSQVYCNGCGLKNRPSKLDNWINVYTDFGDIEVNSNPLTWEDCKRIGASAYHSGQLYEALEYFEQALKFQIDDTNEMSSIFNEIGIIYGQLGDDKKCLLYLNLSVASNPNNFTALENRAAQKIYMGRREGWNRRHSSINQK